MKETIRWKRIDTRHLADSRDCPFDGLVHFVPLSMAGIHVISMCCWCEPEMEWPENGVTALVVHRDWRYLNSKWVEVE